jgi:hypothetical protein
MSNISEKQRQRALFSCDRCKRRKRACKRYNSSGERVFDNNTQCEQCKNTGSFCETTIIRKKRNFFSVKESSILQLKCMTKIFNAMFPDCNPDSIEDIENIAKLLYVDLPNKDERSNKLQQNNGIVQIQSEDEEQQPHHYPQYDNLQSSIKSSEHPLPATTETFINIKRVADELNSIREKQTALKIMTTQNLANNNADTIEIIEEQQMGLGGAERLFTALLEIEKRRSHKEVPSLDLNNSLNSAYPQHKNNDFCPSYIINGNDIQQYLIINKISKEECELYTNYFFEYIHDIYFIFIEEKYRTRESLFFEVLKDKDKYALNLKRFKFSNEEICTFYLVWVLGRKGYLLNLRHENILIENEPKHNLISDYKMKDYLNAINLCLSGCFFSNNLATVRMLHLSSLYHASIKNRGSAWHLMANACIKCIGLGYHRNYSVNKLPEEEQEEIKIVWWACFKLHVTNCSILGRLPNVSLYEVDLDSPKLNFIDDPLFRNSHNSSIKLLKIVFLILKNREYLIKSRNPWCEQTFRNVLYIKEELLQWERTLDPEIKRYKRLNPKRYQIKLHLQYHHSVISLTVPYLIAYALKPKKSIESNTEIIKTLCCGIDSAIETVYVISYSSLQENFNGLLFYDLFYAYNALMMLLLSYTLTKTGSLNHESNEYNIIADILNREFNINIQVILNGINDIKDINSRYGSTASGILKDASNNITLLLKHFKIPDIKSPTRNLSNVVHFHNNEANVPQLQSILNPINNPINAIPQLYTGEPQQIGVYNNNDTTCLDAEFFEIINQMNMETHPSSVGINDKFLWDWNKLFSTE